MFLSFVCGSKRYYPCLPNNRGRGIRSSDRFNIGNNSRLTMLGEIKGAHNSWRPQIRRRLFLQGQAQLLRLA